MAGLLYVVAYGVAWRLLGLEPADREVLNWLRRRRGTSGAAVAPSEFGR
jgi:hypothetical protein